jgi:hypothetical protein
MWRAKVQGKAAAAIGLALLTTALVAIAVFLTPILLVLTVAVAAPLAVAWTALPRMSGPAVACSPSSPPAEPRGPPRS